MDAQILESGGSTVSGSPSGSGLRGVRALQQSSKLSTMSLNNSDSKSSSSSSSSSSSMLSSVAASQLPLNPFVLPQPQSQPLLDFGFSNHNTNIKQVVLAALSHLSTQESPSGLKPVKQPPQVVVPAEQAALFKLVQPF